MRKKITITIIAILFVMITASTVSQAAESSSHTIEISTENTKIKIKETIYLTAETNETVKFWIQNGATDFNIKSGDIQLTELDHISNVYSYIITSPNITKETQISVILTYNLPEKTENFQKKCLINNTLDISVELNEEELYTAKNLKNNSYFNLKLYEFDEPPLTWYIIGFIILLIILLCVTAVYSIKKQKPGKKVDKTGSSEEVLSTKKALLMSLLKEIEKQHRAKKISDNTYHKLREQYKQEAVDTMKKLEEIESKVK